MKKLLVITSLFLTAHVWGVTFTTPNAYMVENTSGTDPSGTVCYDFQTKPTCSAYIVGLSTQSLSPGSTLYVQVNPAGIQPGAFDISSGTVAGPFISTGTTILGGVSRFSVQTPNPTVQAGDINTDSNFAILLPGVTTDLQFIAEGGQPTMKYMSTLLAGTYEIGQIDASELRLMNSGTITADFIGNGLRLGPFSGLYNGTPALQLASGLVQASTGTAVEFTEYQLPVYVDKSTVTWDNGNEQTVTLTANTTFVFNNPSYSGNLTLRIATGAGGFTGTWPAAVLWSGGVAPTLTATTSKNDVVSCHYSAATTKYYCVWTGNF